MEALTRTLVDLHGAAGGRGGRHPGTRLAPDALAALGLEDWLGRRGVAAHWRGTIADPGDEPDPLAAVAALCRRLAAETESSVSAGRRFCVFGGDHSCAVGTWSGAADALAGRGRLGLVWFDAHMDAHTPETSPSGRPHGMPLAALLGHGAPSLTGIARSGPAVAPESLCLIGVHSFEAGERALLERLGVRVVHIHEVRSRGLAAATEDALAIARRGTAGFGVSIDLDAIDPAEAPGVGSPVAGGLAAGELAAALAVLGEAPEFVGLEIAEYNPELDRDGATAQIVRVLVAAAFAGEAR
jgi:arginase